MDVLHMGIVYVLAILVSPSQCYPNGAPTVACEQMVPYHPDTTTSGNPPFAITMSQNFYLPGSVITGSVYSPTGVKFRGFLIEARVTPSGKIQGFATTPYGQFRVTDRRTHTNCGNQNLQALTHNDNSNKTDINFTWIAPDTAQGDLHFKLTIVEQYNVSRFWLNILSANIEDCSLHPSTNCSVIPSNTTTASTLSTSQATTPTPSSKIPFDKDCGTKKGCFPNCPDGCDYLVTWQHNSDDKVVFQIQTMLTDPDNVWTAIGLSPTGKMDGTNVAACLLQNSNVTVQSSYNQGYENFLFHNTTLGLSNMYGSAKNGILSCTFTRAKKLIIANFYDLDNEYYLLVGTGPVSEGMIQQHTDIPHASNVKVNFLVNDIVGVSSSASLMIKLHASLMVIAWILFSSIGVVAARHCKSMCPDSLMCNVKYWFVVHRSCMILAVLCVVVAFVIVFIEVGGLSEIEPTAGRTYTKAHPYLGIAVTVLTIVNPIMALFRPVPTHKKRIIFNWAHFGVGTSAHLLAIITIFFGINLDAAKMDSSALIVMIIYTITFVLVQTIFELYNRRHSHDNNYARLQPVDTSISSMKQEITGMFTRDVLILHIVLMALMTLLMILKIYSV